MDLNLAFPGYKNDRLSGVSLNSFALSLSWYQVQVGSRVAIYWVLLNPAVITTKEF